MPSPSHCTDTSAAGDWPSSAWGDSERSSVQRLQPIREQRDAQPGALPGPGSLRGLSLPRQPRPFQPSRLGYMRRLTLAPAGLRGVAPCVMLLAWRAAGRQHLPAAGFRPLNEGPAAATARHPPGQHRPSPCGPQGKRCHFYCRSPPPKAGCPASALPCFHASLSRLSKERGGGRPA